ncbi:hypothetical protein L1857_11835 [Amycolatopsis thermalba]|uniref:PE domain-containing protein n=1 Tax=Amycolatopsis thermalba TaxID=944492 RepID=A0ABY4NTR9_9PSEU|nr:MULTISPECIES: hypothetical protein [Amycolatopsis]UQS23464.1 hypothetical protein L1857_11835 [Amycolatopsis thermalba]
MAEGGATSGAAQIAGVFGGEDNLNKMHADAKRMLADAKAGRWAVDEETGTHLRRAVTQMQEEMSRIAQRIDRLQRAPKFGNDEYAQRAAAHFLAAMDSDDQSLVRVFLAAQEMLDNLRVAIEIAISKYDASDEAATQALQTFKDQDR